MATVRVTRTIRAGTKLIVLKPSATPVIAGANAPQARVFNAMHEGQVAATATQLRVMAEEARELVVGRLYAHAPQPPGAVVLPTPPVEHASGMPPVPRQPANYRSLTRGTVQKKIRLGLDGRFLIAAGDYLDGIEVFKGTRPDGGSYYMVRLARRKHKVADGETTTKEIGLTTLARVHEFGSHRWNIPARPHWRPAIRDIAARLRRLRRNIRAEALRESLRRIA